MKTEIKNNIRYFPIREEDNDVIAEIVRTVMKEFNADPKTTIIGDPSLNTMYKNYQVPRSIYYMVEVDGKIVGGCGIKQVDNTNENICELQRMFILPTVRGKGLGKELLKICLAKAKEFKYDSIYLETLSEMKTAIGLYESVGFHQIDRRIGSTGHSGCNVCMLLEIKH